MKYTKTCKKCKEVKSITDFKDIDYTKLDGTKSKMAKCRDCVRIKNGENRTERKKEQISIFKPDTIECSMGDYSKKTHPNFTVSAIQFHHTDPKTKLFNVSDMFGVRKDKDIKAEIEKCIPLCVRCHAEISQKERE